MAILIIPVVEVVLVLGGVSMYNGLVRRRNEV